MSLMIDHETDGSLNVRVQRLSHFSLTDCRAGAEGISGFVSLNFNDGYHKVSVYVPTQMLKELAGSFYRLLSEASDQDNEGTSAPASAP